MKHLTVKQRYTIFVMLQNGYTQKEIAKTIEVDKSTVNRELKRNCDKHSGKYVMDLAQRKADNRKSYKRHKVLFTLQMQRRVKKLLKRDFSREQIAGRSKIKEKPMISHETIYRWIWEDKRKGGDIYKHLRRQGRKYAKRGSKNAGRGFIPNRVDIDQRPSVVDNKERFSDLVIDIIIGKNHKGAILTINDRLTNRVWIRKLQKKPFQSLK